MYSNSHSYTEYPLNYLGPYTQPEFYDPYALIGMGAPPCSGPSYYNSNSWQGASGQAGNMRSRANNNYYPRACTNRRAAAMPRSQQQNYFEQNADNPGYGLVGHQIDSRLFI